MAVNSGIFTILKQASLISDDEIESVIRVSGKENISIISAVSSIKPELTSANIMKVVSRFYGIPILDMDSFNLDFMPKGLLPVEYIIENKVLPLTQRDKRLKLAVTDPTNKEMFESIAFKTGLAVDLILVDEAILTKVINQNSSNYFKTIQLDEEALAGIDFAGDDDGNAGDMVNSGDDDQPIVKFVHKMIFDAVQLGASDVHFEPYEKIYRVRYRIDEIGRAHV